MFKSPFSFKGRIRRTEYAISYAIYLIIFRGGSELITNMDEVFFILYLIILIPLLWFVIAQGAKRCHDRSNSGWFQVIPFYILYMLFADGDYGPNKYGDNPKGKGNHDAIEEIGAPIEPE